ncbi:hypothetical protein BD309DRAFT_821578, partial [Dichomitus squalens]
AQESFAGSIGRIKAVAQGESDDESDLPLDEDTPRTKVKRPAAPDPESESEESDSPEEEDGVGDNDDDDDDDEGEEISAADARKFIKAIRKSKKKNKFQISTADADPKLLTEHFKTWGRHCHRLCGLYTDIHKTIVCGMTVMRAAPSNEDEFETCYKSIPNMSAANAKFYTKKFFHLCDAIPKFTALCEHILLNPEDVFIFAKFMQVHAAAGRTTDISTLKASFHSYFPYVVLAQDHVIPPPGPGTLSNLKNRNGGYCSTSTGRLVVPIDERASFDLDPPKYCKQKITQNKKFQAANSAMRRKKRHQADRPQTRDDENSYPSYLFPTNLKYDNARPDRHIFKSDLVLSCLRHLFCGRSSVGRKDGSRGFGRAPLVVIYSITKITPDYLVYITTLLRYLLSPDDRWSGDDKERSGHRFHTALYRLLTVEYEAWEEDMDRGYIEESEDALEWNIFAWFNDKVFGSEAGASDEQDPDASIYEDGNDENNVRARVLKARMAELQARRERRTNDIRDTLPPNTEAAPSRSPSCELIDTNSHFVDIPADNSQPAAGPSGRPAED